MHELISHLGLRFYLFESSGTLKYTLTRKGKPPKEYEINESDLDGSNSDASIAGAEQSLCAGLDASAVGVQLRLIRNDGVLKVEFEGTGGSSANWKFDGLSLTEGGWMVGSAATQTEGGLAECPTCGVDMMEIVEVKDEETQTDAMIMHTTETQTKLSSPAVSETQNAYMEEHLQQELARQRGYQFVPRRDHLDEKYPNAADILGDKSEEWAVVTILKSCAEQGRTVSDHQMFNIRDVIEEVPAASMLPLVLLEHLWYKTEAQFHAASAPFVSSNPDATLETGDASDRTQSTKSLSETTAQALKRKASSVSTTPKPHAKRTKTTHDSNPWPGHLYVDCYRVIPLFKGDVGRLHIDLHEGTVWFEGWYGKDHMRVWERKQFDLRDKNSKYTPSQSKTT
jgi:hypothetical protein